jgi:hypothetical protein
MEIGSALAILASANITKPMLERLLGPTFDYLGDGLRDLTEKRARNIGNIVTKAIQKAEDLGAEGEVPPRAIRTSLMTDPLAMIKSWQNTWVAFSPPPNRQGVATTVAWPLVAW